MASRLAGARGQGRWSARALGLIAVAGLLAAGCATVPTVGEPRAVTGSTGQVPQFVQPIPPVPQPGWTAKQIVQGFLAASASFARNHAAAQKFLSPQARRTYRPGTWPVTVVSGQPDLRVVPLGPANAGARDVLQVKLHGQQIAAISDIGQYINSPGERTYTFTLVRIGNQLRIDSLKPAALLLSQASFAEVYQPRNLYLWSPSHQYLVPEPVFAPQQNSYPATAANLVTALLRTQLDNTSWLAGETRTSFPSGTRLIGGKVRIADGTATVNLGGKQVARASPLQVHEMAAQLTATLTSTSYGLPPIVRRVALKINGLARGQAEVASSVTDLVPVVAPFPAPLFYLTASGAVAEWTGTASRVIRNPRRDQVPFGQIAVSAAPTQEPDLVAGAVPAGRGCGVYYGPLTITSALDYRALPDPRSGPCTSVTWDILDSLWAVTPGGVWVLPQDGREFVQAMLPPLPDGGLASYRVLSLRVAPDGVRVAMLVQTLGTGRSPGTRQLIMAAVNRDAGGVSLGPTVAVGPSLSSPSAMSWLDPDHLIVLSRSQLYSVPVNGGSAVPVDPAPAGATTVTAAGPGHIAVGGGGQIWTSSGRYRVMQPATKGASPTYQG